MTFKRRMGTLARLTVLVSVKDNQPPVKATIARAPSYDGYHLELAALETYAKNAFNTV